jgi:DNA helicase-2/ATP-dependent DNA helicase PcrA
MTRARDHLAIMLPQRFYVSQQSSGGDRHIYASRSRFLTPAACAAFDLETWPVATADGVDRAATGAPTIDLAARIRSAWQAPGK